MIKRALIAVQFHNFMSVEYLPVIYPTSREKRENDYMAFAERVRAQRFYATLTRVCSLQNC